MHTGQWLETVIKELKKKHASLREQIKSLENASKSANEMTNDELAARADLGYNQCEQLENYIAYKKHHFNVIRKFKEFEIKEWDNEKYWEVLAKLCKRLELPESALGEWDWLFLAEPAERLDTHLWVGGYRNASEARGQSVDPDPHRLTAKLKAFFENVDDSDLEECLGMN